MLLEQHIEALIFASEKPVTKKEILEALKATFEWEVSDEEFENATQAITEKFAADSFSFQLVQAGGGFQFMTKKDFAPLVNTFLNQKAKKRLTRAALETLSIIAYKQPITKAEIEQIRGVNCDYTVQKLLEKELIAIAGRASGPGHPLTYATSEQFMDYFGINSPADLPKLKEIEATHANEIGEAPELEELTPSENDVQENISDENPETENTSEQEFSDENNITHEDASQETDESLKENIIEERTRAIKSVVAEKETEHF